MIFVVMVSFTPCRVTITILSVETAALLPAKFKRTILVWEAQLRHHLFVHIQVQSLL